MRNVGLPRSTTVYPLSYTILLEGVLGQKKCRQKHGGSDAISMTTGPKIHASYHQGAYKISYRRPATTDQPRS